ncbi:C4-dicarboxylate ABC transporter permease [Vibrio sp. MACH09]|uniref:tripartite tricarboxylate transporter permease n=1 Tax=unclassified Vibrio TaxID=2614977 RepID=UPI001493ACF0|nr:MULTISPECIES: tripartite tricarboxylate transporter permease [unclassified Vibrio]NOI64984.1 tripartite tricarboxylate transporter permease [Vibrio sp. 99-8-1]GLO62610.1 C4-dicarboxylate ABC transporter permease [Vibrio sp. MACH09]
MDNISTALSLLMQPSVFLAILGGGSFGLIMGAMPGLTASMTLALMVPITFFLDPIPALAVMASAGTMAIFAGDIPGALLKIPGTPASAAYCDDAHKLTQKGKAYTALGLGLIASVIGGFISVLILAFGAPLLAKFALNFSSYEYFWLACLGLSCATLVAADNPAKGFTSLLIGLFVATIGLDQTTGFARFTFNNIDLMGGISFIPAMIGMFALAEVLKVVTSKSDASANQSQYQIIRSKKSQLFKKSWKMKGNIVRSGLLGTLVGAIPGAGADIAAWVSYALAKRFSKNPDQYGHGSEEGIASASSANNSSIAGGWIPSLVFGIPGDSGAAIIIGVLYLKDLAPGPTLFLYHPEILYAAFGVFFIANLLLLFLGFGMIRVSSYVLKVPYPILAPLVLLFCVMGSFAINNSWFGVTVMVASGLLGWIMIKARIPVAPAILGMVLGPLLEKNFLTSVVKSDANLLQFFDRPISFTLGALTIIIWSWMLIKALLPLCKNIYATFITAAE